MTNSNTNTNTSTKARNSLNGMQTVHYRDPTTKQLKKMQAPKIKCPACVNSVARLLITYEIHQKVLQGDVAYNGECTANPNHSYFILRTEEGKYKLNRRS